MRVESPIWGEAKSLWSWMLPYKIAPLGLEWDAHSKPDGTEQVKFTIDVKLSPGSWVFSGAHHSPFSFPSVTSMQIQAGWSCWMLQVPEASGWHNPSSHWLPSAPGFLLPRPRAGIKGAASVERNGETSQVGVSLPLPQEHLHSSTAAAAARRHRHLLTGESLYDSISSSLPFGLSALLCLLIDSLPVSKSLSTSVWVFFITQFLLVFDSSKTHFPGNVESRDSVLHSSRADAALV